MADMSSPIAFLNEAKAALNGVMQQKQELQRVSEGKLKKERDLDALKRKVEKEKENTLRDRRNSIEAEYQKQLRNVDAEIRTINEKRAKARAQHVKERISGQTAALKEENQNLKESWTQAVRENKLPGICHTRLYYALFKPRGGKEWLKAILAFLICFGAVPFVLYLLFGKGNGLMLIIFFLCAVIVFGGLYVLISIRTKGRHPEGVKQCREILSNIQSNEARIRNITRSIRDDKGDALYDLREFDDQLTQKNQARDEITAKKNEALMQFDNVTKTVLTDEIDARFAGELQGLVQEIGTLTEDYASLSRKVSEAEMALNNEYTQYIGTGNMNAEKLDRMAEMIEKGEASGISDAAAKI